MRGSFGAIEGGNIRRGVRIVSGNSNVTVSNIEGEAYVRTSFGLVRATRINGPLTVENSSGGLEALAIKGPVNARTSFGGVSIDDVGGRIDIDNQNGAIVVKHISPKAASGGCNPITLRTSFGPIRIYLPANAGYSVDARTSFGRINSELPITVTGLTTGDSLAGKIGNGECELRLIDANSSIEMLKEGK